MAKELVVTVPDIGDYKNVPVIEVLVKPGDRVEKDSPIVVLESEKATMEVPAPEAGVVTSITIKAGDKVTQGDALLTLALAGAEPTVAAAATKQILDVTVPDIGDYQNVPVIEVLVKNGDAVQKDAALLVLESEKATMEVPAPESGIVRGFKLKAGDKVAKGSPICGLEISASASAASGPKPGPVSTSGGTKSVPPAPVSNPSKPSKPADAPGSKSAPHLAPWIAQDGKIPHASPSIRKFARELGVDLSKVQGTGPKNRITREDVQGFVKKALAGGGTTGGVGIPPIPAVDFAQFGGIETKPLARIRKLSATYLQRAWLNIPHVTQNDEADITELEAWRKTESEKSGVKLTLLPLLMKAVSDALKEFPEFNSSLAPDGENLILKKYCHLGFAADTPGGLVVPVIRDVWSKTVVQLATECGELAKKARDGKLKPDEMKGGCFSISSLGGLGVSGHFTPIVNAPEVAILGVSRATQKPVWDGKQFAPRLMLPLSLSYDHRVIDGAYAARFVVALVKTLAVLPKAAA